MPDLSWRPVRRGDTYCSPACGRKCMYAWFEQATADAKALCKLMGKGWKPNVWENLGWHYAAISPCGRIKLHANVVRDRNGVSKLLKGASYIAHLGEAGSTGGRWAADGKTPKAAVAAVIARGHDDLEEVACLLKGL